MGVQTAETSKKERRDLKIWGAETYKMERRLPIL